jgi:hypothetical protein
MVLARLGRVCLRENQFGWQLTLWPGCHVPTLFFTQWCRPGFVSRLREKGSSRGK